MNTLITKLSIFGLITLTPHCSTIRVRVNSRRFFLRFHFSFCTIVYKDYRQGKAEVSVAFVPDYISLLLELLYSGVHCFVYHPRTAQQGRYGSLHTHSPVGGVNTVLVHVPRALVYELPAEMMTADLEREMELEMVNVFRNVMVTGTLLGFVKFAAKDKRIIG